MDTGKVILLIDGYNVIAPVAPPGRGGDSRWLERERRLLLDRLGKYLPEPVRKLTCVVFDAATTPVGVADEYVDFGLLVRFAVGYSEADDLIEELIMASASPKRLTVVSSDHRIQTAARKRSATVYESEDWLENLIQGRVRLAPRVLDSIEQRRAGECPEGKLEGSRKLSQAEVELWLDEFEL